MSDAVDTSAEAVERLCRAAPFACNEAGIPEMAATLRALVAERDVERQIANEMKAERDAALVEVAWLRERVEWLEKIREGAARALCAVDGIDPDEVISDGGHVAWQLHVYQRAHAALAKEAGHG